MTESPSAGKLAVCSARGCTETAVFDVQWNNPKIHAPARRKHWLACAGHRDSLSSYLAARNLLRSVEPLTGGSAGRR